MRNQLLFGAVVFGAAVAAIVGDPAQARAASAGASAVAGTAATTADGDVHAASAVTDLGCHPIVLDPAARA